MGEGRSTVSCQGTVAFEPFGDNLVVLAREHFASGERLLTDLQVGVTGRGETLARSGTAFVPAAPGDLGAASW